MPKRRTFTEPGVDAQSIAEYWEANGTVEKDKIDETRKF